MTLRQPAPNINFPGTELAFPTLTPEQISRVARVGRRRSFAVGELLAEPGRPDTPWFVITSGRVDVFQTGREAETFIVSFKPGQFSGEKHLLSGRRMLATLRAAEPTEVIEVDRESLLGLIQNDPELSEILLRAFLLRRSEMINQDLGDVLVLGSNYCAGTHRVREFLSRNGHPFHLVDLDSESDAQEMLDRFQVTEADVPVVIWRGETVLRDPTNEQIADLLGFNEPVDASQLRDVIIVGAGPAGLAAAVYAASEGLDVLVLESNVPGGQAGSSSRIENYLGFPTGISGQDLTAAAFTQAEKFGARIQVAKGAKRLRCDTRPYAVEIESGQRLLARSIVIATGAQYRQLPIENLSRFLGAGVYYGATHMESKLCEGEDVVVVGGGNSAGQAAVFLANPTRHVHLVVRSDGLADSMSRYLIRRIELNPSITIHTRSEIEAVEGDIHVERIRWRNPEGAVTRNIRHLFVMTGAIPTTDWLIGCVALDDDGFIKTGPALTREDLAAAGWSLSRAPHLLETSIPSVFAVGDVRSGTIKRVASAIGEGSIAVAFVHQVLRD